jgi:hypothetical protein
MLVTAEKCTVVFMVDGLVARSADNFSHTERKGDGSIASKGLATRLTLRAIGCGA